MGWWVESRNVVQREKYTTNRVRESSFNVNCIKPKMHISNLSNMGRYGILNEWDIGFTFTKAIPEPKSSKPTEERDLVDTNGIFDTMSAASIQDDEEGTNLNAKGINTNYVKHYNSINKTREEEQKEEKKKRLRSQNDFSQWFWENDNSLENSLDSSRILESSVHTDRVHTTTPHKVCCLIICLGNSKCELRRRWDWPRACDKANVQTFE